MPNFTWGDSVKVKSNALAEFRPGQPGSVVGVWQEKDVENPESWPFPPGTVYLVEFHSDNEAVFVHEQDLEHDDTD